MYVDAHTHNKKKQDYPCVINLQQDDSYNDYTYFSLGIHPWEINSQNSIDKEITKLSQRIMIAGPLALGETGLDKTISVPMEIQANYFSKHIDLAIKLQIPTIIIHCVRAYPELLEIIKSKSYSGSYLLHDYNGNNQLTKEFLKYNFYFSYLRALYGPKMKGHSSLQYIPIEKLLLESDDQDQYGIRQSYTELSQLIGRSVPELQAQLLKNFYSCFQINSVEETTY